MRGIYFGGGGEGGDLWFEAGKIARRGGEKEEKIISPLAGECRTQDSRLEDFFFFSFFFFTVKWVGCLESADSSCGFLSGCKHGLFKGTGRDEEGICWYGI